MLFRSAVEQGTHSGVQIDESVNILVGSTFNQINLKLYVDIASLLSTVWVGRYIRISRYRKVIT